MLVLYDVAHCGIERLCEMEDGRLELTDWLVAGCGWRKGSNRAFANVSKPRDRDYNTRSASNNYWDDDDK